MGHASRPSVLREEVLDPGADAKDRHPDNLTLLLIDSHDEPLAEVEADGPARPAQAQVKDVTRAPSQSQLRRPESETLNPHGPLKGLVERIKIRRC